MRNLLLISIGVILTSFVSYGQQPVPRIVTSQDFLGSNQNYFIYDIETDPRGYLYMLTDYGPRSFNGFDFVKNRIKYEEKVTKRYIAIHKGYDGKLWFCSEFGISYLQKDSILSYPVSDSILYLGHNTFESVYQDKNNLLHIAPRGHGHFTIDSTGKVSEIITQKNSEINGFVVTQLADGHWFHYSVFALNKSNDSFSIYYLNDQQKLEKIGGKTAKSIFMDLNYESALVQHSDHSFSLSNGAKTIWRFNKNELISQHTFDFSIIKLFVDDRNDLWIGTLNNGIIKAKNSNLSDLYYYDHGNTSAVLTQSYDGGVWCKSSSIGFGYLASNHFQHYSEQSGYEGINVIISVNNIDDKIYFSSYNGDIYSLKNGEIEKLALPFRDVNIASNKFCYDAKNDTYWIGSQGFVYSYSNAKSIPLTDADFNDKTVIELKILNGRVLGITKNNFFEIKDDKVRVLSKKNGTKIRSFTQDNMGNFWFAMEKGIAILEDSAFITGSYKMPADEKDNFFTVFYYENSIYGINSDQLLFNIKDGMCHKVFDQNKQHVAIYSLTISKEGIIWAINMKGQLIRISQFLDNRNLVSEKFQVPYHSVAGSTPHNLTILNDTIYLGSKFGLFKKSIAELKTEIAPSKLNFEVSINNQNVEFDTLYNLDYTENNILIDFDAINFEQLPISFSYMLEGYDTSWLETSYQQQRYTNLSSGEYQFKLRTKTKFGEWSKPEIIRFHIATPYWQQWWFMPLVIIFILFTIIMIFIFRIRSIKKKEKEKSRIALELARLEMKALKAQINPHFIFNSITSAMFYVSQNENKKAESYLHRFSKLIRRVLESSDQSRVKLVDEMELMRHYISLESEQFEGEQISFKISYNGINAQEVMIPPTLIQPYIENAIRHGLERKSGKRTISISFQIIKDNLNITLKDNGIGRVAAKKQDQRKEHKSYGLLISSRRIEVLNDNQTSGVEIKDLYDANKMAIGTLVYFKIPLISNGTLSTMA